MPHKNGDQSVEDEEKEEKQESREPILTFCVLTDIQYADVDDGFNYDKTRLRYYRNSLNLVREAIDNWKQYESEKKVDVKFLLQLGDLIDGKSKSINDSLPAMNKVLGELNRLFENKNSSTNSEAMPNLLHIWGNHEFYNFKRSELVTTELNTARYLKQNSHTNANYYTYKVNDKLTLICLDFYDFSCLGYDETSDEFKKAHEYLTSHNKNTDLNSVEGMRGHAHRFTKFNGSTSDTQVVWLKEQLNICKEAGVKVIICGHLPVHPKASDPLCLAWNNKEILEIIWSFDHTVIAYFSGMVILYGSLLGLYTVPSKILLHFKFIELLN